jgi:integrase
VGAFAVGSFPQVAFRDKEEDMQQADFERLLADTLAAHGRSPRTQETYTFMLRLFGPYLDNLFTGKRLDEVAPEDIEAYQRHLVTERKVGFSSFNQTTCALRFFYRTCLGKTEWPTIRMPFQRKRRTLPEILSPEEVAAIFEACHNLKHKALLMTSYSGGLRLGETLGLLPSDIDSTRMMIRIEQGKGRKDRYVMLSQTLLETLRSYWKAFRPLRGFFEGRTKGQPLSPSTAEKVFTAAAGRAGIRPWLLRPSSPRSPAAATRSPTSYATTHTACA